MKPTIFLFTKYISLTGNSAGQHAVKQDLKSEHINFYKGTKIKAPPYLARRSAEGMHASQENFQKGYQFLVHIYIKEPLKLIIILLKQQLLLSTL